ncbi:MAG: hypothetical protein GF331_16700 [Chitinivibrionales bacterium]|nr:hypothetical protein [Chitinivibrionales bacterium]
MSVPSPSIRKQSMGSAVCALPNHVDALYQNCAALALPDSDRGELAVGFGALCSRERNVLRQPAMGGTAFTLPLASLQMGFGWTTRYPPSDSAQAAATAHDDIRQRLRLDNDRDGTIGISDDIGANIDSVLAIRHDYAPFVHYTQRFTLAVSIPLTTTDNVEQAIGVRAEYFEFSLMPDQAALDFGYLLRFPSSGWSIGLATERILHAEFGPTYLPHESYLWRSVSLGCGRRTALIQEQGRTMLGLAFATSATLRFRKATMHRDAVLEGGQMESEREVLAGLCLETPLMDVFTPRIGVDMGMGTKHFRLTSGARLSLPGPVALDMSVYEEKGGTTDGYVYQIGVVTGNLSRSFHTPSMKSVCND